MAHENSFTDLDVERVRAQLEQWGVHVDASLSATLISGGRSNPTYRLSDGHRQWALRRPPYGHVLPTAHDMAREFRVISALQDAAVPVPQTVGLCRDDSVLGAEFYVMDWLTGRTLRTVADTGSLTSEERRRLSREFIGVLANLHAVDPASVGLADFGRPEGFLDRQLARWRKQWTASQTRERPRVLELLDDLGRSVPRSQRVAIVHGDYKLDNVMLAPDDATAIIGVLDWELATLGDPLADLGMLLTFWDQPGEEPNPISVGATATGGFLTRAEIVTEYAAASGLDLGALDWYTALGYLKTAIILEGIHARHLAGHTQGQDFEVGPMVDVLIDRAAGLAPSRITSGDRNAL